jgi:hypothetical protein
MMTESERLPTSVRACIWLLVAIALLPTWTDPDLWGHVRFGLDFFRDHYLPRIDPYSFTQDRPWINHEWLSEAVSAGAYAGLGALGLAVLKAAVIVVPLILVMGALHRSSAAARLVALSLVLWAALGVTLTVRPQIWSFLLAAVLCRLLALGTSRHLRYLPLLFLPWANLHGGWIVGVGILVVWTLAMLIKPASESPSHPSLLGIVVCSLAATLINPYGWGLWQFLASTVRLHRVDVVEWQPLWSANRLDWIPWLAMTLGVLTMIARRRDRPPFAHLTVAIVLGYASLRVARLAPFFILASVIFFAPQIAQRWPARRRVSAPLQLPLPLGVALFLCSIGLVAYVTLPTARCLPIVGDWAPDRSAGAALKASGGHGRLVTWFGWGEYALWHLSPEFEVSIDGRRETVYSDRVLQQHLEIYSDAPAGLAVLKEWNPEYVWLPSHLTNTKAWLASHHYRLDIDNRLSFVAVRADLPIIARSETIGPACCPG